MKINVNKRVKVVLTKTGGDCYNKYMRQFHQIHNKQDGDVLIGQLWEIMQIFGPVLYMGGPIPFQNCEIEVVG